MQNKIVGNKGEDIACKYLQTHGYTIIERNFRIRGGEIDIIGKDNDVLVFVEVKARFSHQFGLPIESITYFKLKALMKCALFYIQKINWGDKPYRFDVVSIDYAEDRSNPKIELVKNVTG